MKFEIVVIGLGYVGLPLAVEFAKKYKTIGFDIDQERIKELEHTIDFQQILREQKTRARVRGLCEMQVCARDHFQGKSRKMKSRNQL